MSDIQAVSSVDRILSTVLSLMSTKFFAMRHEATYDPLHRGI
jgi:hypothetical protein